MAIIISEMVVSRGGFPDYNLWQRIRKLERELGNT